MNVFQNPGFVMVIRIVRLVRMKNRVLELFNLHMICKEAEYTLYLTTKFDLERMNLMKY